MRDVASLPAGPAFDAIFAFDAIHDQALAEDGAGLGTCWGRELAERMLADAGFEVVSVNDVPDDPVDLVYVSRRPA